MTIRLLDEVLPLGNHGFLLMTSNLHTLPETRFQMKDARGNTHTVSRVEAQEEWLTLLIENGDASYFERLFRDIRIDATSFEVLPNES